MASSVYTKVHLNYFRICHLVTNILPQGLRSVFKQEWDSRYQATLGEWKDTPQNGMDFYNRESPRSRTRNARLLETIKNRDRAQWDCTTLFFAILYSDSIGHGLGAAVRSNVDELREFRNEEFAHMPQGQLSDLQFRLAVQKVKIAFQCLGLSTNDIQNVCKQKSFPTEELQSVLEKHQILEEQHHILEEQLHSDVSSFCILPPKPSHEIAPRESEVGKITKRLERLREANENGLSYLYISGNPGSGKSQLAGLVAQHFYETANEDLKTPTFVMTLNAESSKTLLESYASLGRQIKCPEYTIMQTLNSTDMQFEEQINNLKDLIATKIPLYGSWLLVVDNVSSLCDVHDFLPRPGNQQWTKGQLLITTQNSLSIPSESSFVSHISVSEGMVPTDARCFLAKVSGIRQQGMEDKIAKALDYQPLALASAGVYMKKVRESKVARSFGWEEYLEKLERGMRALTEKELTKTNPSYRKSMTVATKLAIERAINNDSVVKSAFTLLSLCSLQPLHLDILMNYILNDQNPNLDKEEIALQIQGYSLLLFDERESGIFVSVHQVVHEASKSVINECQEPDENVRSVAYAVMSFNQFIDIHLPHTWHNKNSIRDSEHLIPHLNTFAAEVEKVFLHEDKYQVTEKHVFNYFKFSEYFRRLAVICGNHREFSGAKVYCETALKLVEMDKKIRSCEYPGDVELKELGPTDDALVTICNLLGWVQRELGDFQNSKENHERALDIQLKNLGPQHVDVANSYHHLGNVQCDSGNLKEAMQYYERALEIQVKNLGPDHIYVAFSLATMSVVESKLENLQQAKDHIERALDIRLKRLGPEHVDVANIYYGLGIVQSELGDLQKSKECYQRALDIRLKRLGPEHVRVADIYYGLGIVQRKLGDLQKSKECYQRALDIRLKRLGPEHVHVAVTYYGLGIVQGELGDLQKSKECYQRALDIRLKRLGPEHVDVADIYRGLGIVQRKLGDLQKSKECYQRALDIQLKRLGPEHVDVADIYYGLGIVQRKLGDLQKSKECYQRALDIRLKRLGLEHVDVADIYYDLGIVQRGLGDLQKSKECYQRALDIQLKRLGPEHVDVADTSYDLGIVQRKLGDLQKSKECYQRALDIRLKKLGPEHVDVARNYFKLGNVERELCNLQKAKEHLECALDIQLKKLGPEHLEVVDTYHNLGMVHRKWNNLGQAKEYHEQALAIRLKNLEPEHVDLANSYHHLGNVQFVLDNMQLAKELYERALHIQLKNLEPDHVYVAFSYESLGDVHREFGDLEQAKEYFNRALNIRLKKLGHEHVDVRSIQNKLRNVQLAIDDLRHGMER
ncbi:uncharacterized protein [Pocillopora verrucosa]|uniref:uncharacterized protein n=1 Tax=Pocillopora verrucosa TaxID=203993 RepID=UPI0033412F9D